MEAPKKIPGLLTQEINRDRTCRQNLINYQNALDYFENELKSNMENLQKNISVDDLISELSCDPFESEFLSEEFYKQLQKKQGTPPEKIEILRNVLNSSILFRPGIQKILIKIAKEKFADDIFAGKIQFFCNLEANKEDFKNTLLLRTQENGYDVDTELFEELKNKDLKKYETKQMFLFFDILASLVGTTDFKQILQEYDQE